MNWTGMDALHVDQSTAPRAPAHILSTPTPSRGGRDVGGRNDYRTVGGARSPHAPSHHAPSPQAPRRRARLTRLVIVAALAAFASLAAACGDVVPARGWPAPVLTATNGDEQLVVIQTAPGKLTQLAITPAGVAQRWTFPGEDDDQKLVAIYATPIVRSGSILLAAFSGDLIQLGVSDGRPIAGWGGKIPGAIVSDPVTTSGNQMFVATDHGAIHPVDLTSGTIFPSKLEAAGRVYGQGAALRDSVYYGTLDKRLFALDSTTGAKVWETEAGPLLSNIVATNDSLIVGTLDSHVRAYGTTDGSERWTFAGQEWFWAAPVVAGNTVYVVDMDGRAYALDTATGSERWSSTKERGNVRGAPVLAGGALIFATETAIYGLDVASGSELWAAPSTASGSLLASPLVLESGILYVTDSGVLLRVQPGTGALETLYTPK